MNIVEENPSDLKKVIKISVGEKDYKDQVEQVLKKYRKQAQMPGFRPGHVPMSIVKKMYGEQVLADELNKVASESLYNYIETNNIPVFGVLILNEDEQKNINFAEQKEFEFVYELGLLPEFSVNVSEKDKFTQYIIKPDDELVEKQIQYLAKRYGKVAEKETSEAGDLIYGTFEELDENNQVKEDGITHKSTVTFEAIQDPKIKEKFIGLKAGDSVVVDPRKISKGTVDMAAMLNISKEEAEKLKSKFKFTVEKVYHIEPHEINQEFFDKIYGENQVKDIETFKKRVKEDLEKALTIDSDIKLEMDIVQYFLQKIQIPLPDEFLKRWLLKTNEGKITEEDIEKEYEDYTRNFRWQLIESQIAKENDLKIEREEIIAYVVELMEQQMIQYGNDPNAIDREKLRESAVQILSQNEDEAKRIYNQLFSKKVMQLIKEKAKIKEKEVSYEEFAKLVSGKSNKFSQLFNNLKKTLKK